MSFQAELEQVIDRAVRRAVAGVVVSLENGNPGTVSDNIYVRFNTLWDCALTSGIGDLSFNDYNWASTSSPALTVTAQGNVTDDGSESSTNAAGTDFAGPTTGTADAGQGPGSGFVPDSAATWLNGVTSPAVTTDITGISRPAASDPGAYEEGASSTPPSGSAPTLAGSDTDLGYGDDITLTMPSGVQNLDIAVVFVGSSADLGSGDGATPTPPAGFTQFDDSFITSTWWPRYTAWYRVCDGTEASTSCTFDNIGVTDNMSGSLTLRRGADTTTVPAVTGVDAQASTTTPTGSAVTTGATNSTAIAYALCGGNPASITAPSGWTLIHDLADGSSYRPCSVAYKTIPTVGSTGAAAFTAATSQNWNALVITLEPA